VKCRQPSAACGTDTAEDFIRLWRVLDELLDLQALMGSMENGRAHEDILV